MLHMCNTFFIFRIPKPKYVMKDKVNFNYDEDRKAIYVQWRYGYAIKKDDSDKPKNISLKMGTGITGIESNRWDNEKQRITSGNDKNKLNAKLDNLERDILLVYNRYINAGVTPSPEQIKSGLVTHQNKENKAVQDISTHTSIVNFIEDYLFKNEIKYNTSKGYTSVLNKLVEYERKNNTKLLFETLTLPILLDFFKSAEKIYDSKTGKLKKTLAVNSIYRYKKDVRKFIKLAQKQGIVCSIDYTDNKDLRIEEETSDTIYLTPEMIEELVKLDLKKKHREGLQLTKDLAVVGLMTGLRFQDWNRLGNVTKVKLKDGKQIEVLNIWTQKTKKHIQLPVLPPLKEIYERYKHKWPQLNSNQKFNESFKAIGQLLKWEWDISKRITRGNKEDINSKPFYSAMTSHCCRRSFATNSFHAGLSVKLIMELTGHVTTASFFKYVKSSSSDDLNMYHETMSKVYNFG